MSVKLTFLDLLDQAEIWVNKAGETVRVDDMDLSYLCAVQKFLENGAGKLRLAIEWRAQGYLVDAPDLARSVLERAIEEDSRLSAAEFMARYPLYRRISKLLGDRRAEGGWPDRDLRPELRRARRPGGAAS
jgi:hypothetical protein